MPKVKKSSRLAEKRKKETLSTTDTGAPQSSTASTSMTDEQNLQNEGTTNQTGAIDIPDMVPSFKTSVDINVSQELKTKIVNGQYVDLAKLLNNTIEPQKQMIVMVNGELETVEKSTKKITNIEQWTDAFIIYASVYLSSHPAKSLQLLKYMKDLRMAACRSPEGFKDYDQQFRLKMEKDPTRSWAEVDSELWLLFILPNIRNLTAATPHQSQNQIGKCYSYNFQGSCYKSPCNYYHVCIKCNAQHPLAFCPYKDQQGRTEFFRGQGRGFRGPNRGQNARGRGGHFRGNRGGY